MINEYHHAAELVDPSGVVAPCQATVMLER
jgi:hypothetical protein